MSAGTFDPRGALEAVDRVLNRGGDPAAVVRAVLDALHLRGVEFARIQLFAGDRVIGTFETGSGAATTEVPITYGGARVGTIQVAVDDRVFVERLATLVSAASAESAQHFRRL